MSMWDFIKRIFNWFKLFLALDCMGVSIGMLIAGRGEFQKGVEHWGALLLAFGLFFTVGVLLLLWFFRTRKKLKNDQQVNPGPESDFYFRYPKISGFLDGWTFNGFGSSYFTYSDKEADGSLYATKWIAFSFIPVIPLYRERIMIISETQKTHVPLFISSTFLKYRIFERTQLDKTRMIYTRLFYYIFFFPGIILPVVLFLVFLDALNRHFPGPQLWLLILGYFGWGMFLFFIAELFNKKLFLKSSKTQ